MFGLGTTELVVILVIIIVLFGARRLPELGRGIGEGLKKFKKAMASKDAIDVTPPRDGEDENGKKKEDGEGPSS